VGAVIQWGTSNAPTGWFVCAGQGVHTSTYSNLFAVIGYQYGGSGTNFLIPDMRGRVPVGMGTGTGLTARNLSVTGGVETVTLTTAQIPSHRHLVFLLDLVLSTHSHTYRASPQSSSGSSSGGGWMTETDYAESVGGGLSHENMQPFVTINYIIKY